MKDKIEVYGKASLIQHGKMNNRVYLMKLDREDYSGIISYILSLAKTNSYTKIFCKVPYWASAGFISEGFQVEAKIPKFYNNRDEVFFLSKYLDPDRLSGIEHDKLEHMNQLAKDDLTIQGELELGSGMKVLQLNSKHVEQITALYREVFESYPFPIHQADYILRTMKDRVLYFGIEQNGQLIALSSAEVDWKGANAEMTDFATKPDFRGKNLSVVLLQEMEKVMRGKSIDTLYTIARLNSAAMNKTFLKSGYTYAGTLINNTFISGSIESMNVLYKNIRQT